MSRPVHGAYVEEGFDDEGDMYYVATCAETFTACDAYAFINESLVTCGEYGADVTHSEELRHNAMDRALGYLGQRDLHDEEDKGEHFCDADHVHAAEAEAAPRTKTATLVWVSPHYAFCVGWRAYGRVLAARRGR